MSDIICIGEAMLRSMSDSDFESVGGAELNVAVALAQRGWDVTWLTVLPEDDRGIADAAYHRRVDTVVFRSPGVVGSYTVNVDEEEVSYQRSASAFAKLNADDIPVRNLLASTEWVHLSGITPMLGEGPRTLWNRVLTFAELDGVKISLDINHRPALSSREELWQVIEPHLRKIHFLSMSSSDLEWISGHCSLSGGSAEERLQEISRRWLINIVGCTFKKPFPGRRKGWQERWSIMASATQVISSRRKSLVHRVVEHLGSGDAWVAGALCGLRYDSINDLFPENGDSMAAVQQLTPGDFLDLGSGEPFHMETELEIISRLMKAAVIPILRCKRKGEAQELADRYVEAGARALEFSLDTPGAMALLARCRDYDDICAGIGTVTEPEKTVMQCHQKGGEFLFSATNPDGFIEECKLFYQLPVPGVSSIEEARTAVSQGALALKLFHATKDWAVAELAKVREMFPQVMMIAVGGLGADDVESMFELGMDAVGIGEGLVGLSDEGLKDLFKSRRSHIE